MYVLIGLGNPGSEYQTTRHNAGFQCLDIIAEQLGASFHSEKKFSAEVARAGDVFLLKPQTFMNDSGRAVQSFLKYYADQFSNEKNGFQELYVLYDDLDIELGQSKIQFGKGPKVHNGVNSIVQHLGTDQFWHVRLGIDSRQGDRRIPSSDYVLTPFSGDEKSTFDQMIKGVAGTIKSYVQSR